MYLRSGFASFVFVLCVSPVFAQTTPTGTAEETPTIKAETRAVIVDVVVTKGRDEPVTGLKKDDFAVMEDGKPQTVVSFEEHTVKPSAPLKLPPMPPNVFTNVPEAPPAEALNVLLLDGLNTPRQDQSYVREQIVEFLKKAPETTPLALFTLGDKLRLVQGFNGSRAQLLAALGDSKSGLLPQKSYVSRDAQDAMDDKEHIATMQMMLGGFGRSTEGVAAAQRAQSELRSFGAELKTEMTIEALQNLARYLAKIPGRKNLIWFATQFPLQFFPSMNSKGMYDLGVLNNGVKEVADLLTVSRVAIYPVGAHGMDTRDWMEAESAGTGGRSSGGALMGDIKGEDAESAGNVAAMTELAAETGGEMIHNTNDLAGATTRAIDNGSHYYTLSYSPTNRNMDGQLRSIQLKLAGGGKYKLSYRHGYYAYDDTTPRPKRNPSALMAVAMATNPGPATTDALKTAPPALLPLMQHGSPNSSQILYGLRVQPASPQPEPGGKRAGANASLTGPTTRYTLDFMIRWNDVHLVELSSGAHVGELGVQLIAYDNDGKALNWVGSTMKLNLKPELFAAIRKSGIPAHLEIDVPKGDVSFATGVYDWKTGRAGTLEVPERSLKVETAQNQAGTSGGAEVRK